MGISAGQMTLNSLTTQQNLLEKEMISLQDELITLSNQQEEAANLYAEKVGNFIYETSSVEDKNDKKATNLQTLAAASRHTYVIADASGTPMYKAIPSTGSNGTTVTFKKWDASNNAWVDAPANDTTLDKLKSLNSAESNYFQNGVSSGALRLYQLSQETELDNTNLETFGVQNPTEGYLEISLEASEGTTKRYYTEDDAQAQAEYNGTMSRLNKIETTIQNKINRLETTEKDVSNRIESQKSLNGKTIDRSTKYFNG